MSGGARAVSNQVYAAGIGKYGLNCAVDEIPGAREGATWFYNFTVGHNGWTAGNLVLDGSVWERFLLDADWTANGWGVDDQAPIGMDHPGLGIAYLAGHGVCGPPPPGNQHLQGKETNFMCANKAQCAGVAAPTGTRIPVVCANHPPFSLRDPFPAACPSIPDPANPGRIMNTTACAMCRFSYDHQFVTCQSTPPSHGEDNLVNFSEGAAQEMRVGESFWSGDWGGAGDVGGVNLLVIDASCPTHPGLEGGDLGNIFAGVHMVATLSIVTGDTGATADRGAWFGFMGALSPTWSVSRTWLETMGIGGTSSCPNSATYTSGGINGCGCYTVQSKGATTQQASAALNQNWTTVQIDNDHTGANVREGVMACNYNTTTFPPVLP